MLSCTSNKASAVFGVAGLSGADLHVTALKPVMNPALMMPTSCFAFWCEISHRCLQPWCHCGISAHAREKQQPALLGHSLSNPPSVPHLKSSVCLFVYLCIYLGGGWINVMDRFGLQGSCPFGTFHRDLCQKIDRSWVFFWNFNHPLQKISNLYLPSCYKTNMCGYLCSFKAIDDWIKYWTHGKK